MSSNVNNMENFGDPVMRKEYAELRRAELDFERSKADRELRKWCIEQMRNPRNFVSSLEEAQKLYDWVRNQPKADAA